MRSWDIASGKEVHHVAGPPLSLLADPRTPKIKNKHHFLRFRGNTLEITQELPHGGTVHTGGVQEGAAPVPCKMTGVTLHRPVACFLAPQRVDSVRCHGATICVGCEGGAVCILQALFLGV